MQYKFFFAALILLISHCSFAQSFRYTQYTTHNGLPVDNIYAAAQDDNGYMWFATDFGIAKFDGYRFITFNRNNGIQAKAITDIVYAGGDSCVFLAYPGYIQSINGKGQVHTIAYVPNIALHQLVRFKNILLFYERGKNIFGILKHGAIENIDLEKFTGMQGLTVNAVTAFNENTVAVSTNKGLFGKKENETAVQY
jgi:ligand-binding sensor domain-containing protein